MDIILVGVKHCGKTTIGQALAGRRGCAFYDLDEMIESTYACQEGRRRTVREIFATHGEREFRRLEGNVVCELVMKMEASPASCVVAVGGATVSQESARRLLGDLGLIVYLKVGARELFARIERGGLPPFLAGEDPYQAFVSLYQERSAQCERLADCVVDLDGLNTDESIEAVEQAVKEHDNARQ